ncbi:hypothetical protein [Dyadobacter sp. Leaf189]|uniref:hypothetical protein n=1 Tax=Dyadobacter sp. Leaf189 TaxID=1736295 RepID=UPI0006FCBCBC|nr:hypothetical protein [Dyadobacter sp. Leaf189]KQS33972.1 hypothetical protein ASG33_08045 [Dyadobacter sp. Leaf189]
MTKAKKSPEIIESETTFNLTLGGKVYTLRFGTATFIRIKAARPSLSTAFHVSEEIPPYEAIPFLIDCAIKPEDKDWSCFEQFVDLYDECEDPAISKVIPGYLAAAGTVAKKLEPALRAVEKLLPESGN